jgi:ubiquinone/menaquinone biosynthesis C-methylase UbiE
MELPCGVSDSVCQEEKQMGARKTPSEPNTPRTLTDSELVIAAFTELADEYEATVDRELRMFWDVSYRDFLARFLAIAAAAPGECVLDVATGTAFLPPQIAATVGAQGRIVGLDITPAMLVQAAQRLAALGWTERTPLVCGSALAMPLADASFDLVLCALGTHHMKVPLLAAEMRRVVRPGGRIVLADVCANDFWRSPAGVALLRVLILGYGLSLRSVRAQAEIEAFNNVRTPDEWRVLLTEHGFGDIAIETIRSRYPWYPSGIIVSARPA